MGLSQDLREFIALLNAAEVKYLVVGGYAVAFHGYPRYTGDIDFLVEPSTQNANRLEQVLHEFGFGSLGLAAHDFLESATVVQLGRPPHRIDLVTSIDGVSFAQAWAGKIAAELDGLPVCFIGKAELVKNKRAAARPQDLADLSRLEDV